MRRADLERAASRVVRILGEADCLLVGGLAVGAHGYVRATADVDFVVRKPLAEAAKQLRAHGIEATLRRGDRLESDVPCVTGTVAGTRVDLLPPPVPLDWENAIEVPLGARGAKVRVVTLAGLIHLKLRAHGPKDLMDVAALVLAHPAQRSRALELAMSYGVAETLGVWLEDSRLRAEVAEGRARERESGKHRSAPKRGR